MTFRTAKVFQKTELGCWKLIEIPENKYNDIVYNNPENLSPILTLIPYRTSLSVRVRAKTRTQSMSLDEGGGGNTNTWYISECG